MTRKDEPVTRLRLRAERSDEDGDDREALASKESNEKGDLHLRRVRLGAAWRKLRTSMLCSAASTAALISSKLPVAISSAVTSASTLMSPNGVP